MSRKEFFIEYYKRTDSKFADHTINSKSAQNERTTQKAICVCKICIYKWLFQSDSMGQHKFLRSGAEAHIQHRQGGE